MDLKAHSPCWSSRSNLYLTQNGLLTTWLVRATDDALQEVCALGIRLFVLFVNYRVISGTETVV
uniref:Uncharacterized protein n=1 Tax=Heterorhabditis bacteriophora TaxID=37862 RepID=A0A1I7WRX7_HETBA